LSACHTHGGDISDENMGILYATAAHVSRECLVHAAWHVRRTAVGTPLRMLQTAVLCNCALVAW